MKDKLFNRRRMAYGGLIFSALWFLMVFWVDFYTGLLIESAKVVAYLSVPSSIAGLGFWQYLKACQKDDDK